LDEQFERIQDLAIEGQDTRLPSELKQFAWILVALLFVGVVIPPPSGDVEGLSERC
jgi:hypothetical protein